MEHVCCVVWTDSCRLGYRSWYSDLLQGGRSTAQIPVAIRFSAPIHTGSGAHPASSAVGTSSFPGVKLPGHSDNHPPPCSPQVKEIVELYLYSPSMHL